MTSRSRRRSGSLLFPLVLIAAGILLLLSNLGVVQDDVWPSLLHYWPVLIIALGLDLLLGRPSFGAALGTLIFACLVLAVGGGLFYVFAPSTWTTGQHSLSYPAAEIASATIALSCERCAITIEEPTTGEQLIEGTVTVRGCSAPSDKLPRRAKRERLLHADERWSVPLPVLDIAR